PFFGRELGAHELLPAALHAFSRPGFAKHTHFAVAPTPAARAEPEKVLVRLFPNLAGEPDLDRGLVLLQIGDAFSNRRVEIWLQDLRARPSVRVRVVYSPTVPHCRPPYPD